MQGSQLCKTIDYVSQAACIAYSAGLYGNATFFLQDWLNSHMCNSQIWRNGHPFIQKPSFLNSLNPLFTAQLKDTSSESSLTPWYKLEALLLFLLIPTMSP